MNLIAEIGTTGVVVIGGFLALVGLANLMMMAAGLRTGQISEYKGDPQFKVIISKDIEPAKYWAKMAVYIAGGIISLVIGVAMLVSLYGTE